MEFGMSRKIKPKRNMCAIWGFGQQTPKTIVELRSVFEFSRPKVEQTVMRVVVSLINNGVRCSFVVRAFPHVAMGRQIDSS